MPASGGGAVPMWTITGTSQAAAASSARRSGSTPSLSWALVGAALLHAWRMPGELIDPILVSAAFARAADAAYESVRNPAEGTMLSAVRAMAHRVAQDLAHMERQRLDAGAPPLEQDKLLADVLEGALEAGKEAVELTLRARSDLNKPLQPGTTGDLIVTVTNDNGFPIKITSVTGSGPIVADPEHAEGGCADPGVQLSRPRFDVLWDVGRNTIGAFNVPGGLTMRPGTAAACDGATFTVPVRVSGVRKNVG